MTPPKKFLIVRTDRIGDVVLSLPIASVIKKHLPDSTVTFLVRDYTKSLVENNSSVDEVITAKFKRNKLSIIQNISTLKKRFDVCVAAYPTFRIGLILFLSGIKIRIGTGYRWYSFLFNKKIYEHRKYGERHELEYNIRLLKTIGIEEDINESNVAFNLHTDEKSEQKIDNVIKSLDIAENEKIIIVHPGSGGSAVDLPLIKLKSLVEMMAHELSCRILITGSKSELKLCESLVVNMRTKNIAGKFELNDLITLIDRSVILIANSTGPIHIAAALGKHVVGFYPKIAACSPKRWGPYTTKKIIFTPTLDCNNCTREQCEKLNCMDSIDIKEVFKSVKKILN